MHRRRRAAGASMARVSKFDGLNPEAVARYGRPVWDLSVPELSVPELVELYERRGIMPARLRLVRGDAEDTPKH